MNSILTGNSEPTTFDNAFTLDGKMYVYLCDGMPTMGGCGQVLRSSRKIKSHGSKPSGWLVTPALGDDGEDKTWPLFFCPSCRKIVQTGFK